MFVSDAAKELFAQAQTLSPEARSQFVTDACRGDESLFQEVDSLLQASQSSEEFFNRIVSRISLGAIANDDEPLRRGKLLGPWRLGECIGRGGMGTVYLAERADDEFQKQAAIKLLPFGADSQKARERFLTERQILARLVHDNIARLLDGGVTDEGVPFFVMDYVKGENIDEYCRKNDLGIVDKLELILQITDALRYAHANLVVHRDLKPANVLVEENGRVRLLDFGVAKMLDSTEQLTDLTQYAQRPVTPAFASPQMLRGEPVDVTTDVYSTGVLIYWLITSKLPIDYEGLSVADSITVATEKKPVPASAHISEVGAELDLIISKAMAKNPSRRYLSIDGLATDLRNYLAGRPVNAKEPTRLYHFRKFVGRNTTAFFTGLAAAVALIALTIVALMQSAEANRQRDLAVLEQQRVQASNEFYGLLMEEMDTKPFTSVELLDRGTELLEKQYGMEEEFMGPMLFELSRRYARLNERKKQSELLKQAEALAIKFNDDNLLASVTCRMSSLYRSSDPEQAAAYVSRGKSLYAGLRDPSIEASVDCLRMQARVAVDGGDTKTGLDFMFAAEQALDAHPAKAVDIRGPVLGYIAHIYFNAGQREKSIEYLDRTLSLLDSAGRGNSVGYLRVAANKAITLDSMGQLEASLNTWQTIEQRLGESGYFQRGAAALLGQYAETLTRAGQLETAHTVHSHGLELAKVAEDENNVAINQLGLARVAIKRDNFDQALMRLEQAQVYFLRPENVARGPSRSTKVLTAKVYRKQGEWDKALTEILSLLDEIGYPEVEQARGLDSAVIETAAVYQAMEDYATAEVYADDAISRMKKRAKGDPMESVDVGRAYIHRAEIRASSGNASGAIEDLDLSIPILVEYLGKDHQESIDAIKLRATL